MSLRSCVFVSKSVKLTLVVCALISLIQSAMSFVIIDSHTKSNAPKHKCDCIVKTVNYLKEFVHSGYTVEEFSENDDSTSIIKCVQELAKLDQTGDLNEQTCNFVRRRWQSKIVHWSHHPTEFFNVEMNDRMDADQVQAGLEDAANNWKSKTNLVLVAVDGDYSEIQFSFIESANPTCDSTNGGEALRHGDQIIGCVHLPGYDQGGKVEFYEWNWTSQKLKEAADKAFGFLLGVYPENKTDMLYNPKIMNTMCGNNVK